MDGMRDVRRVVIHDKHPILDAEVLNRPANRAVLAAAGLSVLNQIAALVQVLLKRGDQVGWFDHTSFAVVSFLWLLVGLLVFMQRRGHRAGQLFLLSAAAGSVFLALGTLTGVNLADALLFSAGVLFFPAFLLSFTRAFQEERTWRRAEALVYLPPLVLVWPMAQGFLHSQTPFLWRAGVACVGLYFCAAVLQTGRDLLVASTPERAAQTRALLFGLLAGSIPALFMYVLPLALGNQHTVSRTWQPHLVLLFLLAMSYAVLLFEFSEADLILRRGVVYGMLTLSIVIAYAVLGVILAASSSSVTNPGGGLSFVAVTVIVGAAFGPIRRTGRRLVDWLLYGRPADRWELLQELSEKLSSIVQPDELGEVLVSEVTNALHLRGAFLLRRTDSGSFVLRHRCVERSQLGHQDRVPDALELTGATLDDALGAPLQGLLLVHARPLTATRREVVPERYRVLDDLGVAFCIPLVTRTGLEAVLCLQPKVAHDAFDADDRELLAPVMRQATSALDNALLFERLQEKVGELRHAYMRIAREQEAERARLARELHDGTAQELASLITLATVAERQMGDGDAARCTLDRLRQQAEDAYQGVRRASHALRPLMLDDFGLGPTLDRYVHQFEETTGIRVESAVEDPRTLPDEVELALFRVAQECLENVRKHSGAERASLSLHRRNGHVVLAVEDNGLGLQGTGQRGIGLAGMRERVEAVGGMVRIESTPGRGLRVEAEVPVGER